MAEDKVQAIKEFLDGYTLSMKTRCRMHGSPSDLEGQWHVPDLIFFIIEGVSEEDRGAITWGAFLCSKGYGAKSATRVIEEKKLKDPYKALVKLRIEYEWGRDGATH
jgi:hypothetical protein